MGSILLQAVDHRIVGSKADILIHEISSVNVGKLSEMEDEMEFLNRLADRALDIYADRSTLTKTQIKRRWKRKDWWLDAEEAVELGFADEIG
jgi:ATP-dependent protease ClpP protease subunit